jgi:hypothetical protein
VIARSFGVGTRLTCTGNATNQATLIAYANTSHARLLSVHALTLQLALVPSHAGRALRST